MSFHYPFCRITALAVPAVAALVLLTPASILPARAQVAEAARQGALSDSAKSDSTKSDGVKPPAAQTTGTTGAGNVAAVDQQNLSQQKSLTAKAIEKVKEAGLLPSAISLLPVAKEIVTGLQRFETRTAEGVRAVDFYLNGSKVMTRTATLMI